jgi:hypothetical protein
VVELSTSDVTSVLRRPLEAEIDNPQLRTSQKKPITCERYTADSKHVLNANRKLRSTNRLVTLSPVFDVI